MSEVVTITQRYRSARDGTLVDALTQDGWDALLARVTAVALTVEPYADEHGSGVNVTVATQRGAGGAFAVHDLACRYGALAVIR